MIFTSENHNQALTSNSQTLRHWPLCTSIISQVPIWQTDHQISLLCNCTLPLPKAHPHSWVYRVLPFPNSTIVQPPKARMQYISCNMSSWPLCICYILRQLKLVLCNYSLWVYGCWWIFKLIRMHYYVFGILPFWKCNSHILKIELNGKLILFNFTLKYKH